MHVMAWVFEDLLSFFHDTSRAEMDVRDRKPPLSMYTTDFPGLFIRYLLPKRAEALRKNRCEENCDHIYCWKAVKIRTSHLMMYSIAIALSMVSTAEFVLYVLAILAIHIVPFCRHIQVPWKGMQ
jgi:hypothetical protein